MKRTLPIAVALILIVVTAVVQGRLSERWAEFPELQLFAAQFANVPMQIGEWTGKSGEEPTKKIMDAAGAVGSLSREYHTEQGDSVSVFLVCGRLQDMFYHEPKRCYRAAGFEMQDEPQKQTITTEAGDTAEFFSGRFIKTDVNGKQDQQVYWSWCGSDKWEAPDEPKWTFAGQRALYKIYVVFTPSRDHTSDHNPATEFIPVLIPELNKAFAPALTIAPKEE